MAKNKDLTYINLNKDIYNIYYNLIMFINIKIKKYFYL